MRSSADLTLREYAEELASLAPTPGAYAVPAVLAASLVAKAARQTAASEPFSALADDMEAVAAEADELRAELLALVEEDERAFEQAERDAADRLRLRSGDLSRRVLELAATVAERGHPFVLREAAEARSLAAASLQHSRREAALSA
ncbi:MAG TPA: cyclodeaminase/cyclohydrolase family protein [Gaiellaceae bacterium]|nr:cyclodeaminase/cyclohydrolase family protein [Gaiellaceae bacterium]